MSLLAVLVGCRGQSSREKAYYSDSLVVCPSAKEINYAKYLGTDQVSYKIQTDYPADDVLSLISKELKSKGWRPLEEDYLNLGLPSSHVRGWTEFGDATTHPETYVHQWLAQWENNAGDIVWYTLQYRYPKGRTPNLDALDVIVAYIPAKVAKAMKRHANRSLSPER
jgi:hypothetical protein